jgi:hypothetical protein
LFQQTNKEYQNQAERSIFQNEFNYLKSQIVISTWAGTRKLPFAYTKQRIVVIKILKKIFENFK